MNGPLTLPLPPSANRYWRMVDGRMLVSHDARVYKLHVSNLAFAAGVRPTAEPVCVTLRVYRARRAGDLDNYVKVLVDALKGVAYHDDAQVTELHAYRDDDKDDPRVVVRITEAERTG